VGTARVRQRAGPGFFACQENLSLRDRGRSAAGFRRLSRVGRLGVGASLTDPVAMKTILLLRHAKSAHGAEFASDHERTLTERGERAARHIGRFLAAAELIPDLVLTSTAVRAVETVRLAAESGGWQLPIESRDALYLPSPEDVLSAIQHAPDSARRILVVGHEPAWSTTASRLSGGGRYRFPTAGLGAITVPVERWQDVAFGRGELQFLIHPRLLEAAHAKGAATAEG